MATEQARNFGLDSLCQKRPRAVAQNLGQLIGKSPWLRELENISVGHGVSLLCWRSGGLEHPHDTPPYPFTPSPTFAHSSQETKEAVLAYHFIHKAKPAPTAGEIAARIETWLAKNFGVNLDFKIAH